MMRGIGYVIASFATSWLWACGEEGERVPLTAPGATSSPTPAEPTATAEAPPAQAAAPSEKRYAKVLEVLKAGDYTIARMDACGQEAWTAGPPAELAIGQTVEMNGGTLMENFHSKSLDRDFETILFVGGYVPSDQPIRCPEPLKDDPGPGKPGHGGGGDLGTAASGKRFTGKVVETMDSGGYTYVKLAACGKEQWFAGSPMKASKGQTFIAVDGLNMTNFTSKSLGRVFDSIMFVRTLTAVEGEPKCD